MAPTRLDTRHVYLPLSSGRRFFRLSVHFFLCSLASGRAKAWSSFIHMMSGRGCPLATHLSRTELPTGRAITRRLILDGCVKRGRAAGREWHSGQRGPRGPGPPTRGADAHPTACWLGPPGPLRTRPGLGSPFLGWYHLRRGGHMRGALAPGPAGKALNAGEPRVHAPISEAQTAEQKLPPSPLPGCR